MVVALLGLILIIFIFAGIKMFMKIVGG